MNIPNRNNNNIVKHVRMMITDYFTERNSHIYNCRITQWKEGWDVLNERSCEEWEDGVNESVNDNA